MIIFLLCLWLIPPVITVILSILDVSRYFSFYGFSFVYIGMTLVPIFNWMFFLLYVYDALSSNETITKQGNTYKEIINIEKCNTCSPVIVNISDVSIGDIISVEQIYTKCDLESGYYTRTYNRLAQVLDISKTDDKVTLYLNGKWEAFQVTYFYNQSPKNEEKGELSMDFAFDEELEIQEVNGIPFFIDDGKIHNIPQNVLEKIKEFKEKGKKIILTKYTYSDGDVDFIVKGTL